MRLVDPWQARWDLVAPSHPTPGNGLTPVGVQRMPHFVFLPQ
jgi:hypothetical protein